MADDSGPPPLPGGGGGSGDGGDYTNSYTPYVVPTNGLWLQITNVANGLAYVNLNNATDYVYEILSKTDLNASNWNIELEVFSTNWTTTPFTVPQLGRTNLYLWARDWTGVTENGNTTPDWWFWEYYGTTALSDTNLDGQGTNTLLYDYQHNVLPNAINFSLVVTNQYVNSTNAAVQLNLSQGAPGCLAVMVDDTNFDADAIWQPFPGTNINVNLGSTEGWHTVWIGLKTAPATILPFWQTVRFKIDLTPPQIIITGPSNTISQGLIQLTGFSPEALSGISCDISNAFGIFTNQQVLVLDQNFDTNNWEYTTNTFQAFDIGVAPGTNTFTIHATDLAGNSTATNFNVTVVSDTNAPVITLTWPQDGAQLCGSNFTISGTMDDPSATITAMLVDMNGNTNLINGMIERNGQFWMDNLPLTGGTNWLTLTAVDVWGNTSTTNFSVSQSVSNLTIGSIDSSQVYQATITVDGSVGDPAAAVWVNGVQATNNGAGYWSATNVPITPGGTASFHVSAYPASDVISPNTNNPGANPIDPNAYSASTDVIKPSRLYVDQFTFSFSSSYSQGDHDTLGFSGTSSGVIIDNMQLNDGSGGSGTEIDSGTSTDNGDVEGGTCTSTQVWAPSYYPDFVEGDYASDCGSPRGWFPAVVIQHEDINTPQDYYNSWSNYSFYGFYLYQESGQITAQTRMQAATKLFTGGRAYIGLQTLWVLSAAATENRLVSLTPIGLWGNPSDTIQIFQYFPVPPQSIAMGEMGNLGSDGLLHVGLPNGVTKTETPTVKGLNNYTVTTNTAGGFPMTITANNVALDPEDVVSNATFCVGQQVTLSLSGLPGGATAKVQWVVSGTKCNSVIPATGSASPLYHLDTSLFTNTTTSLWWYDQGGEKPIWCYCTITFANGQTVQTTVRGVLTIFRPGLDLFADQPPAYPTNALDGGTLYLSLGDIFKHGTMNYAITIETTFSGKSDFRQLINRYAVNGSLSSTSTTYGAFYLDNYLFLLKQNNGPDGGFPIGANTDTELSFSDNPGFQDVATLLGGSTTGISDQFIDYVMFRPDAGNSASNIYVSLGKTTWSWNASTTYASGAWASPTGSVTRPTNFDDSIDFPTWTSTYINSP